MNFIDVTYKNKDGETVVKRIRKTDDQGFTDKTYALVSAEQKDFEKEMSEIEKKVNEKLIAKRAFEKEKNHFDAVNVDKQLKELLAEKQNLENKHTEALKTLLTTDVFTNESQSVLDFEGSANVFSLRAENDYQIIDEKNTIFLTMVKPNNSQLAEILPEGGTATTKDITADINVLKTDDAEIFHFNDITKVGFGVYADAKNNFESIFDYVHNVHLINAENFKAFEMMYTAKDALTITPENVQETINNNLSANAKRNAVIVVNKSGFAKLDRDINGTPLVVKNSNNAFVYKAKYKIVEVPDSVLPNTDAGESRIIIGDMSIARFFLIREETGEKYEDNVVSMSQLDKVYRKEIIALADTSNESYIHGVLV